MTESTGRPLLQTTSTSALSVVALHGRASSLLISVSAGNVVSIVYWGERLHDDVSAEQVVRLKQRHYGDGVAGEEIPISLMCEPGTGFMGPPGIEVHRDGQAWALRLRTTAVQCSNHEVSITTADPDHGIRTIHDIRLDPDNDVARMKTTVVNDSNSTLTVAYMAAGCVPIESLFTDVIEFSGRWAGEFQTQRTKLSRRNYAVENRRGRTSHDRFPGVIVCADNASESGGSCLGVHLGWSGNHRIRIDALSDGRKVLQAGELILPGEIQLKRAESYVTPELYLAYSANGLTELSAQFHDHYRRHLTDARARKPRLIHYNTWEGIYFDQAPAKILELVDAAADLGVERFVLDDGWFKGRRDDTAGLGDWRVDEDVYPDGLTPVIEYTRSRGMDFGLWVEPEMVNVDSHLYHEHQDWILGGSPDEQIPFRHQFVLDLARPDVTEYLFDQLDELLREHDIAYLKWDMNRDLNHPVDLSGCPSVHRQTHAVYALIDKLRSHHPDVEIESCSSGGGRVDFGILERTDRVWASDSNDALDRQLIQRGASFFFPLSILGTHVGPSTCKITLRQCGMSLRAATALFGHMGIEADLLAMTDNEKSEFKDAVILYKQHRELIHAGKFHRLDGPADKNTVGVVSNDKKHALFSCAQLTTNPHELPGVLRFPGLDPATVYSLRIVWPTPERFPLPQQQRGLGWQEGAEFSGELLQKVGVQLPLMHPEMCLIYELKSVS